MHHAQYAGIHLEPDRLLIIERGFVYGEVRLDESARVCLSYGYRARFPKIAFVLGVFLTILSSIPVLYGVTSALNSGVFVLSKVYLSSVFIPFGWWLAWDAHTEDWRVQVFDARGRLVRQAPFQGATDDAGFALFSAEARAVLGERFMVEERARARTRSARADADARDVWSPPEA